MYFRIVDEDGKDITNFDVSGELCVRGPTVVPGYLNNPVGNQAFDTDGFYHTGDIGYCEAITKKWYIIDRKKELIKVRGFQVAPPELEGVLMSHPQIIDAAVIGIRFSRDDSQLPRAYIVKRPGAEGDRLTAEDVKRHMKGKLARFKQLEGGIKFISVIPRNASGKILKRVLRDEAKKEMDAKL
jgi:acyl-CoA synthetase (AMP-forming)/AMP-acid ligase II